jgi:YHS domain-containing protein
MEEKMKRHTIMSMMFILIVLGLMLIVVNPINAQEKKAETQTTKVHTCCAKSCCPVCKTELPKNKTQFKSEYKGKTIYFDSAKCKAQFDKTPEKYMKACETTVYYVCPMKEHTEKFDKPGKCPKCGMELKKVEEPLVYYICPMKEHTEKFDKPGKCPKCGMELKKVDASAACCSKKTETTKTMK